MVTEWSVSLYHPTRALLHVMDTSLLCYDLSNTTIMYQQAVLVTNFGPVSVPQYDWLIRFPAWLLIGSLGAERDTNIFTAIYRILQQISSLNSFLTLFNAHVALRVTIISTAQVGVYMQLLFNPLYLSHRKDFLHKFQQFVCNSL